jgi:hypothetical protein
MRTSIGAFFQRTACHRGATRAAVLAASALLGAGRALAGAELLTNGNFNTDADANGQPDGWTNWSYGPTSFAAYKTSPTDPFTENGTPYVNAGNYGDWWTSGGGWYQVLPSAEGIAYRISVDCATEGWDNAAGEMRLIYLDPDRPSPDPGPEIRRDLFHTAEYQANQPWTTFSATSLAPAGTKQVKAEIATWGARGSVMWDNISLVVTHAWNVDADGSVSVGSNWLGGAPGGVDSEAQFLGSAITAPRAITIDAPVTLGSVRFDGANKYTLGGATLTIDTTGAPGAINVIGGSHQIDAPLTLAKDTVINVSGASNALTLTNLQTTTVGVTKSGAGALVVNSIHAGALAVNGGNVQVSPHGTPASANVVGALTIAGGATPTAALDLTNNGLVVDYTGDSPLATIQSQLASGYASGSWNGNGINSSAAAADATSAHKTAVGFAASTGIGTFMGQPIDDTAVLIRHTYSGDANLDGKVDTLDFNSLAANFGGTGKIWSQADFNYDGVVDTLDFNNLAANFGQQLADGAEAGALVPEPAAMSIALVGAAVCLIGRSRRRYARG